MGEKIEVLFSNLKTRYHLFWALLAKALSPSMSSTRPVRSTRIKAATPVLPEIISRINLLVGNYYECIRNEVEAVIKFYKEDTTAIAEFWLTYYEYNLLDFKHIKLLNIIFNTTGLKQALVVKFLNNIEEESLLSELGVVRVNNGKKMFYRIRVGETTDY